MSIAATPFKASGAVRGLEQIAAGIPVSDGDGVKLTRIIGSPEMDMVDPFLLLDLFESDQPDDYIGGFPDHPHRGFETVTYLLAGRMRHWDNAGHEGVIEPGDVQWMTAGRGVIHSEMPEQDDGLLQGFQLWVNLPSKQKMQPPSYQEFPSAEIPVETLDNGCKVKVIAGRTNSGTKGPVVIKATAPLFIDVELPQGATFQQVVPASHNGFIYVISGSVGIGNSALLPGRMLGVFSEGDRIVISSPKSNSRFLVIAGMQLGEPVARGGPFVMNTREEILQTFDDYRQGRF